MKDREFRIVGSRFSKVEALSESDRGTQIFRGSHVPRYDPRKNIEEPSRPCKNKTYRYEQSSEA